MNTRFTFVRYENPEGLRFVGSGYFVNGHAVLTAGHVANGSNHRVVFAGEELPVQEILRSENDEVDLAVLTFKNDVAAFEQIPYAELYRGGGVTITDVWAVGYPRLNKDEKGRSSLEVKGYIIPAEGTHPAVSSGADGEWLTLVGTTTFFESQIPEELYDTQDPNPWGGMSGAVAVKSGMVIGVIRSPIAAKGPQALAVTPITALRLLPERTRRRFCEALGLNGIDALDVLDGSNLPVRAPASAVLPAREEPTADHPEPAFSAEVQDQYRSDLVKAGLPVPDEWNAAELGKLRHAYQATQHDRDKTTDTLEALCLAVQALPVLEQAGGRTIGSKKLWHLYKWHVGCSPEATTFEGMLVRAASASIAERHRAESDPPNALARFMLAVAGQWKASISVGDTPDPRQAAMTEAGLRRLVDWLTGPLVRQQEEDVVRYLDTEVGCRYWALIELAALDFSERMRPTKIVIDLISESGTAVSDNVEVTARPGTTEPEEDVCDALREAISRLPKGDLVIDLCLPRRWLDAGVEHWDVLQVGHAYKSISWQHHPRLRWAMHRHDPYLRTLLEKRVKAVDWSAAPEQIPPSVTDDPVNLQAWLDDRDQDGTRPPPYITAFSPADESKDPMGTLLQEGYGFAVWFGAAADKDLCERTARIAADMETPERRHELPERLATRLGRHRPVIIWSDPEGRAGFPLPGSRGGGTRRKGRI